MSQFEWVKPLFGADFRDPSIEAIEEFLASKPTGTTALPSIGILDKSNQSRDMTLSSISPPEISPSPTSSIDAGPSSKPASAIVPPETTPKSKGKRKSVDGKDVATQNAPKHSKGDVDQTQEDKDDDHEPKLKTSDRRKEQNRNAQRAFRERKEKRLQELEVQLAAMEETQQSSQIENTNLRDLVTRLQSENRRLSVYEQAFTFTMNTIGQGSLAQPRVAETSGKVPPMESTTSGSDRASPVATKSADLNPASRNASEDSQFDWGKLQTLHQKQTPPQQVAQTSLANSTRSSENTSNASSTPSDVTDPAGSSSIGSSISSTSSVAGLTPSSMTSGINPSALLATSPGSMSFGGSNGSACVSPVMYRVPTPPALTSDKKDESASIFSGLTFLNENDWDPSSMTFGSNTNDYMGFGSLPGLTPSLQLDDLLNTQTQSNDMNLDLGWTWATMTSTMPDTTSLTSAASPTSNFTNWRDQSSVMDAASLALFQAPPVEDHDAVFSNFMNSTKSPDTTTTAVVAPLPTEKSFSPTNGTNSCTDYKTLKMKASTNPCMQSIVQSGQLSMDELDDLCLSLSTKATCSERAELMKEIGQKHPVLEDMMSQWGQAAKMAAEAGGTPLKFDC